MLQWPPPKHAAASESPLAIQLAIHAMSSLAIHVMPKKKRRNMQWTFMEFHGIEAKAALKAAAVVAAQPKKKPWGIFKKALTLTTWKTHDVA